jgi:antitoxin component YwqK of YwqJK toxin-antitoxin module
MLLFIVTLFSGTAFSQIRHSDLRNENGGPYDYYKGSAYYNDSLYTGGVEKYYSDTVLWSKTSYANGEPNGYEIFYFESGTPWCIGLRENRAKQGEWVFYRRNGEIQGVQVFKDGYEISEPIEIEEQP